MRPTTCSKLPHNSPRCQGANFLDHPLRRILEEKVVGIGQLERLVIGKRSLPSDQITTRKSDVLARPEDQCWLVRHTPQTGLQLSEVVVGCRDLIRIERRNST